MQRLYWAIVLISSMAATVMTHREHLLNWNLHRRPIGGSRYRRPYTVAVRVADKQGRTVHLRPVHSDVTSGFKAPPAVRLPATRTSTPIRNSFGHANSFVQRPTRVQPTFGRQNRYSFFKRLFPQHDGVRYTPQQQAASPQVKYQRPRTTQLQKSYIPPLPSDYLHPITLQTEQPKKLTPSYLPPIPTTAPKRPFRKSKQVDDDIRAALNTITEIKPPSVSFFPVPSITAKPHQATFFPVPSSTVKPPLATFLSVPSTSVPLDDIQGLSMILSTDSQLILGNSKDSFNDHQPPAEFKDVNEIRPIIEAPADGQEDEEGTPIRGEVGHRVDGSLFFGIAQASDNNLSEGTNPEPETEPPRMVLSENLGRCPLRDPRQCPPRPDELPTSCGNDFNCTSGSQCCFDPCLARSTCVQPEPF